MWGLNRPKSKNALGKNIFKEILEAFEEIRVGFCFFSTILKSGYKMDQIDEFCPVALLLPDL